MVNFRKLLDAWLFDWRLKRAIKKADWSARTYRRKYLVIVFNKKPECVSMQGIKHLIRTKRFAKGFTAEKARQMAVYEANPKY
jgi:hypothetical protein